MKFLQFILTLNEYEMAGLSTIILIIITVVGILSISIYNQAWAWIDDKEETDRNFIISKLYDTGDWKYYGGYWRYYKGNSYKERTDQCDTVEEGINRVMVLTYLLLFTPISILLLAKIYIITLTLLLLGVIAYLTRFARRHKKLFDKHVVDKEAHK